MDPLWVATVSFFFGSFITAHFVGNRQIKQCAEVELSPNPPEWWLKAKVNAAIDLKLPIKWGPEE